MSVLGPATGAADNSGLDAATNGEMLGSAAKTDSPSVSTVSDGGGVGTLFAGCCGSVILQ